MSTDEKLPSDDDLRDLMGSILWSRPPGEAANPTTPVFTQRMVLEHLKAVIVALKALEDQAYEKAAEWDAKATAAPPDSERRQGCAVEAAYHRGAAHAYCNALGDQSALSMMGMLHLGHPITALEGIDS